LQTHFSLSGKPEQSLMAHLPSLWELGFTRPHQVALYQEIPFLPVEASIVMLIDMFTTIH